MKQTTMTKPISLKLAAITKRIKELEPKLKKASDEYERYAIETGGLLKQAKNDPQLKGKFEKYVNENFKFSHTVAWKFMKIASGEKTIEELRANQRKNANRHSEKKREEFERLKREAAKPKPKPTPEVDDDDDDMPKPKPKPFSQSDTLGNTLDWFSSAAHPRIHMRMNETLQEIAKTKDYPTENVRDIMIGSLSHMISDCQGWIEKLYAMPMKKEKGDDNKVVSINKGKRRK